MPSGHYVFGQKPNVFHAGIVATTFGHDTFKVYMYGPSKSNPALSGASSQSSEMEYKSDIFQKVPLCPSITLVNLLVACRLGS